MSIDMHCHILTEEMIRLMQGVSKTYAPVLTTTETPYPSGLTTSNRGFTLTQTARGSRQERWPEAGHDIDLRLEDMTRTDIDCQAVSQFPGTFLNEIPIDVSKQFSRVHNEQFAQLKREHPGRFAPLAAVPIQNGQAAADELEHAVRVLGLHGVATSTSVGSRNLDDPDLEPFYAKLNELQVPWTIHPSEGPMAPRLPRYYLSNLIGNPTETSIAVASLIFGGVFERYPNIRVWTVHAGGYVPFQYGRSAHDHCWRDEPRAVISRSPTDYLGAFKFDVITHSQPALNSSMRLFSTEVLPALRVPVAVSPA